MKRIGVLFEAEKKKKASKSDKPSYWRTVRGQHIGFDGDPPNGRPVIGPKQITKYLMVPKDESIEEGVFTEASIAKMNRRAKAAGDVESKNPDSKNYSPKEISTIKKAVQDEIDNDTSDNFSRVEERKDGVYLVMDCYKNVHPAYLDVAGEYHNIEYSKSKKGGDWIKVPKDAFGGFVLEFRATIGKGGKVQYEFVDGKYDRGFVDAPITKDIVDSAADAAKRGITSPHGGVEEIRGMIASKLNEADLIDVWGSDNFDLYEPYGDKYPMPRSPEVSSRWNRWRRR